MHIGTEKSMKCFHQPLIEKIKIFSYYFHHVSFSIEFAMQSTTCTKPLTELLAECSIDDCSYSPYCCFMTRWLCSSLHCVSGSLWCCTRSWGSDLQRVLLSKRCAHQSRLRVLPSQYEGEQIMSCHYLAISLPNPPSSHLSSLIYQSIPIRLIFPAFG